MELQILQVRTKSFKLPVSQSNGRDGLYTGNHVEHPILPRSHRRVLHPDVLEQAVPRCSIRQEDSQAGPQWFCRSFHNDWNSLALHIPDPIRDVY